MTECGCDNKSISAFKACLQSSPPEKIHHDESSSGATCWNTCECLDPPEQNQVLTSMGKIVSSDYISYDHIAEWMYHLIGYTRSYSYGDSVKQLLQRIKKHLPALRKSLRAQVKNIDRKISPTSSDQERKLQHLVMLASAATVFVSKMWAVESRKRASEVKAWQALEEVNKLVFEDKIVDPNEKLVLKAVNSFAAGIHTLGAGGSALQIFIEGFEIPSNRREPIHVSFSGDKLYINRGAKGKYDWRKKIVPKGYKKISSNDPRAINRPRGNCAEFALGRVLSHAKRELMLKVNESRILREEYRPVDLKREPSKVGDIVLYLGLDDYNNWEEEMAVNKRLYPNFLFQNYHIARVSSVDKSGFPQKVISQMGRDAAPIYEHPVDEAILSYGFLWVVYRKK